MVKTTYVIVLVDRSHPFLTLKLSEDLSGVLDNDLVWLKGTIAADAISAICRFDDLDTNIVLTPGLSAMLQALEVSIAALGTQSTVPVVTFVEHVAVLAVFVAASIFSAHTKRQFKVLVRFPEATSVTDENI